MGEQDFGIDPEYIRRLASEIRALVEAGAEIGLVIGGGNIFRGAGLAQGGMKTRATKRPRKPTPSPIAKGRPARKVFVVAPAIDTAF